MLKENRFKGSSRTINFLSLSKKKSVNMAQYFKRDESGRIKITFYSDLVSSLNNALLSSNAMLDKFREEIEASVALCPAKEKIVLVIYESSAEADDDARDTFLRVFKRYIAQYREKSKANLRQRFLTFLMLALSGVFADFLLYTAFLDLLAPWLHNLIDVIATVLIWEFVAYLAYEFRTETASIRRLKQLLEIEYIFQHWE